EEGHLAVVDPAAIPGLEVVSPHLAVGGGADGQFTRQCDARNDRPFDFFAPALLAVGQVEGGDLAAGAFEGLGVVADIAAPDDHDVARDGRSAPGIELEAGPPAGAAGLGVEAMDRPVADL